MNQRRYQVSALEKRPSGPFSTAPGSYSVLQSLFTSFFCSLVRLLTDDIAGTRVSSHSVPSALGVLGGTNTDLC
jgi:hypothetical protein